MSEINYQEGHEKAGQAKPVAWRYRYVKKGVTDFQENINNSMWNYGAALSLIMLLLIAATSLFSTDDKDNTNEGGGLW